MTEQEMIEEAIKESIEAEKRLKNKLETEEEELLRKAYELSLNQIDQEDEGMLKRVIEESLRLEMVHNFN